MATVNKDFKIKSGLIVEGTTATVNGFDVLTKKTADQTYIVNLIGGTATSADEANKVVKRDANGDFAAGTITADVVGDVTGNVTGTVSDISNHNTSSLSEGNLNLYFTNQRALDATNAAYDAAGSASAAQGAAATDATNKANAVASDLTDHENATEAHGATGAVVGTTNTQTLTNKTIGDTLNFTGAGAMTINSDSHIVLTPAAGSSVKWGADVLATQAYADQAEADAISTASADATTKANNAKSGAEATAASALSTAIGTEVADRNSAITSAINTEVTDRNSAIATAVTEVTQAAYNYTDAGIAGLVDSAPELLDTLNELAEAIANNPNYATDVANLVATKADTSYVNSEISDLDTAAQGYASAAQSAAISAASADAISKANAAQAAAEATASADATSKAGAAQLAAEATASADATSKVAAEAALRVSGDAASVATASADATSKANAAQAAAISYTDGEITDALVTAQGYASDAQNNAQTFATNAINGLDTDDIEEGATNLYHTDVRAKASAAALLTGATKTNITITGNGAGLTITAENGVADSDTDDLVEGETNLYYTDARVDARMDMNTPGLSTAMPEFTEVTINEVAKQVAATLSAPTAGIQVAHAFAKADYRSAEYLVKVAYGNHTEISKVLLTLDSSDNIAITEYGIVGTNGSASSISAGISGTDVQLLVTTANNTSTVTVVGTLVA